MCKIPPRLKDLAKNEGITIGALERSIGASKGVISRALANGTDIQSKWLQAIVENYPQYSAQWLLAGTGDMLINSSSPSFKPQNSANLPPSGVFSDNSIETKPRIPYDAAAGSLSVALEGVNECECEQFPIISSFPKYDFTIIARGDSMIPEFQSGDELACAFVKESSFIQWGRPHILDTAQGIVLKKIFNNGDSILCRSVNNDYPDFEVPKNEIYNLAIIVGLLRHF